MLKPPIPLRKPTFPYPLQTDPTSSEVSNTQAAAQLSVDSKRSHSLKKKRDNPHSDRFIEVGTKALRRELMSGETLRATRQQLRLLCASDFCFSTTRLRWELLNNIQIFVRPLP